MRIPIPILALLLLAHSADTQDKSAPDAVINSHFEAKWKEAKLKPAGPADGFMFYRRLTLDVTGKLPEPKDIRRDVSKKPAQLVDAFLASPAAAEFWADLWMQWLNGHDIEVFDQLRCDFGSLHDWLKDAWAKDMPYDKFVRALLSDRGGPKEKPAANYAIKHLEGRDPPVKLAIQTSRLFVGKDIRCAQCHDDAKGTWTQKQFWEYTEFFRPLQLVEGKLAEGTTPKTALRPDLGEQRETAVFLDGRAAEAGKPLGEELARLVTTTKEGWHARALLRRLWKHYFGREPEPEHASLEDALVKDFLANGQKVRRLVRGMLMSKPYQMASDGTRDDRQAYAVGPVKYMNAVQFLRAYIHVFRMENYYDKLYAARRKHPDTAQYYRDPQNMWLMLYRWAKELIFPKGRDPDEALSSGTVRMSLKMMNNGMQGVLLIAQFGMVREVMSKIGTLDGQMDELFLKLVGRPASADEKAEVAAYAKKISTPVMAPFDAFWALVNSQEFVFIR